MLLARLGILPTLRYLLDPIRLLPLLVDKQDTPSLQTSLTPVVDLLKVTYFHYREVRHFVSLCKNPQKSPRINKIKYKYKALGNNKANNKANVDSKLEN